MNQKINGTSKQAAIWNVDFTTEPTPTQTVTVRRGVTRPTEVKDTYAHRLYLTGLRPSEDQCQNKTSQVTLLVARGHTHTELVFSR